MARTLMINIQVDRLPDVDPGGKTWCQLGLRVSAAIAPDAMDPTLPSDKLLVQPWLWRAKRGDADGTWKVHEKTNWTLWQVKEGSDPLKIDEANWKIAVADPATFDPEVDNNDPDTKAAYPKVRTFHARVNGEIDAIVNGVGVRALEVPGSDGVVSERTVFGLIESLTGLPDPVPAGMQLWTAVSIDQTAVTIAETDRFLAAPSFATPIDIAYSVDMGSLPGAPAIDMPWEISYASDPVAMSPAAKGRVQPSLPMTMLQIAADDTQRLIDLSALLVRQGDGPAFETTDWNTTLPLRIAETIDPAARAMAVLDKIIRETVASDSATREALRADILPIEPDPATDYLREALAALCEPVLAPRARSSRPTAAPAAASLERMALGNPALWPTVAPLLFAQAAQETDANLAQTPQHFVVSHARIADAAGIVPGRADDLADDAARTIDSEQTFREWIVHHWTSGAGTSVADTNFNFRGTATRFYLKGDEVSRDVSATGVVNFSGISGLGETPIVIPLKLGALETLPAVVTFTLGVPGASATVPTVVFKLTLDPGQTQLSIEGVAPETIAQTFVGGRLSVGITRPQDAGPLMLDLKYEDAGGWLLQIKPIDKTAALGAGRLGLLVNSTAKIEAALDLSSVSIASLQGAASSLGKGQAIRSALSLAYAGPCLAGLMGGWAPIEGTKVDPAAVKRLALRERLIKTISEYAPETFDGAFALAAQAPKRQADEAIRIASDVLSKAATDLEKDKAQQQVDRLKRRLDRVIKANADLAKLWESIRDAAKADAMRLASEIVPIVDDRIAEHVTQDAPPLTFVVDQLQDFDESVDLWTRLAGLGILIGRRGGPSDDPDEWWSLNVATLHISRVDKTTQQRDALGQDNAVPVNDKGSWPTDWPVRARVDPVPLVVSEISGVRSAVISYQSQSIVAEIQNRPQLDPRGQARAVARRPEAYLFPVVKEFPKLPPLTFGRTYDLVPYLIGHGGVKPPLLRSDIEVPTSSFPYAGTASGSVKIANASIAAPGGQRVIRSKTYLRTVPIGAPRVSPLSVWPGLFDGVAPLAAELPAEPAPITLRDKLPARFFLDKGQTRGTLNSPPDILDDAGMPVEITGIRIEIGSIDLKNVDSKLTVKVEEIDPSKGAVSLLTLEVTIDELAAVFSSEVAGLRIDVVGDKAEVFALNSRAHFFCEDEPDAKPATLAKSPVVNGLVSQWQSFAIVIEVDGADFDAEPPSVRWGALRPKSKLPFQLHGDRPSFPPELLSSNRDIAILDGIRRAKGRAGPDAALIKVRRPATTLATYDRWVNGPLSKYGNADEKTIRAALNAAASRATGKMERGKDRALDDPIVEALVFEVVRLFPQRSVDQPAVILKTVSGPDAILGLDRHGDDIASVTIKLDEQRGPLNGAAKFFSDTSGTRLELASGCVYELRFYGAARPQQPLFAPANVLTLDRFAPAAAASWRDVDIDGKRWHLGPPLIRIVEVASEVMPELYINQDPPGDIKPPVPMAFSIDLLRPPTVIRERATIRLEPDFMPLPRGVPVSAGDEIKLKYAALRYVDRIALLEQRWSWRGRPHAEIPVNRIEAFGENREIDEGAKFVDMAFAGRSDDDIGTIHEMRITRAHAYRGRSTFESAAVDKAPTALERDLDYRGGANLWRFALRAKSRYASMRPNDPVLIRFSHKRTDLPNTRWWPFIVPDRAPPGSNNRKPVRPGLALVIPLTEPLMTAGSVPPLLALFNEAMFPLFNAGDGIESVVEVARHPFIGAERIGKTLKDFTTEFKTKWEAVVKARQDAGSAESALDFLRTIDADPQPDDLTNAQTALDQAMENARIGEDAYTKTHAIAVAWGYAEHLGSVVEQVTKTRDEQQKTLDAEKQKPVNEQDQAKIKALGEEIKRLDDRLVQLADEITIAKDEATYLEANPTPAGDALRTGSPFVKYWPEFAPDPIRTGAGATGEPLALRCDGPVGYTFDLETEAGRFDHTGFLITPVADRVRPWSLVKLRFRRLEAPELLVGRDNRSVLETVTLAGTFVMFRLASDRPNPPDFPITVHEGLAFDVDELTPGVPIAVRFSFDDPEVKEQDGVSVPADFVLITATVEVTDRLLLTIRASTKLGSAEQWQVSFETGGTVQMRIVISQRPKPDGDDNYRPAGDVSVRIRILRDTATDALQGPHEDAWLSVICMPLNARDEIKHDADVLLRVRSDAASTPVVVRPVRLSDFTPGVWCQFAAVMSRVVVDAEIQSSDRSRAVRQAMSVSKLTASADASGKTLTIGITGLRSNEVLKTLALTAEGEPDNSKTSDRSGDAQVEERLYAVVTRYIYDAFDRLRERPVAVHQLSNVPAAPALGEVTWSADTSGSPYAQGSGRVRILRILRGRASSDKGFEPVIREFPEGFFGTDIESQTTDEPLDAAGQVLGISPPIEWSAA
ncbi:hypothetical protein [Mesorhizobium sp. M0571]|uniref:hypothetical protein n=1 Tax=Mesorhizobium sp. M0571 TaxID=2956960 RepID=UPI00333DF325